MIVTAAVLTASITIDLSRLITRSKPKEPAATCHISTTGYRFRGTPGQRFRYAGETWEIPEEGWIELLADKSHTAYAISDRTLPTDVWPRDAFGFREIPLPTAASLKGATQ